MDGRGNNILAKNSDLKRDKNKHSISFNQLSLPEAYSELCKASKMQCYDIMTNY